MKSLNTAMNLRANEWMNGAASARCHCPHRLSRVRFAFNARSLALRCSGRICHDPCHSSWWSFSILCIASPSLYHAKLFTLLLCVWVCVCVCALIRRWRSAFNASCYYLLFFISIRLGVFARFVAFALVHAALSTNISSVSYYSIWLDYDTIHWVYCYI